MSTCLFLYRIPASKAYKTPLLIAVAILAVSNIILTLLWILQCLPVAGAWDMNVKLSAKWFTKDQLLQIILAQGTISDFALVLYPVLLLAKFQLSWKKKLGLWLLMGFGVITGACSIVCCVLNWTNESEDNTWDSIPNWMWRTLEVNFSIAAACIPALYPGNLALRRRWSQNAATEKGIPGLDAKAHSPMHRDPAKPAIAAPDDAILRTTAIGIESSAASEADDLNTRRYHTGRNDPAGTQRPSVGQILQPFLPTKS